MLRGRNLSLGVCYLGGIVPVNSLTRFTHLIASVTPNPEVLHLTLNFVTKNVIQALACRFHVN